MCLITVLVIDILLDRVTITVIRIVVVILIAFSYPEKVIVLLFSYPPKVSKISNSALESCLFGESCGKLAHGMLFSYNSLKKTALERCKIRPGTQGGTPGGPIPKNTQKVTWPTPPLGVPNGTRFEDKRLPGTQLGQAPFLTFFGVPVFPIF